MTVAALPAAQRRFSSPPPQVGLDERVLDPHGGIDNGPADFKRVDLDRLGNVLELGRTEIPVEARVGSTPP